MSVDIKLREFWGAAPPRWSWKLYLPVTSVFTSYTYSSYCSTPKSCIDEMHYLEHHATRIKKCPAIRYNFLIGGDGLIYEGRGWLSRPSLPPKYTHFNKNSLYIGFIGIFSDYSPSDQMYQLYEDLIIHGVQNSLIAERHLAFNVKPAGRGVLTKVL